MRKKLLRTGIRVALLMCATCLMTASMHSQEKSSRSNWTWNDSDGGRKIEVKAENQVVFNDDYSDVADIPYDGALRIYDSRGAHTVRLIITPRANGELQRDYSVDGQTHGFDAQGRTWLRSVLLEAVHQGLDARTRVERILRQRGPRGLMDEIAYLKSDYVRRIYFEALLQSPGVTNQDLKTALRNASTTMKSDYERAQLLTQVTRVFLANNDLAPDYFAAAGQIDSAYERARALSAALSRDDLSKDALAALARAAAGIDSDYEKATLLIKAAERYQGQLTLRTEWLQAVRTIKSDYEFHRALSSALKPNQISPEALSDLVRSAARIKSDYEKASFLIEAMNHYRNEPQVRAAFTEAARTISSEYERGRVQKRFDSANF